jgi:DNA-binding NarL/FixJ family response regulator
MKAILAVVVVDAAVENGRLSAAINKIKTAWPQINLVILVEDELEFQAAQAAGGDVLLRKGFPAAKFIQAVETLLSK